MRLVCGIMLLVDALLVVRAPAQWTNAPRGDALAAELKSRGEADVLVMLVEPPTRHGGGVALRRQAINALREDVVSGLDPSAVRIRRQFSMVSGFTATVTARGAAALRADPAVLRIDPMMYGGGALAQSVPRVRADAVQRRGDLGQGVTVAVLDAGVDTAHPDLAGSIVAEHCICTGGCCPDGSGEQAGPGSAFTDFVHGIHVTGIIVSKGLVAPAGIAP
ncbi:MAG: S8 family serine peptidase, partial [Candidatus Binatia bacterium]